MNYRKILPLCLVTFVLAVSAVQAQPQTYYLPQVGNGTFAGGSMRTTFVLFNPTDQVAIVNISLTDNSGGPLSVTIPGQGTGDEFGPLTLQPAQSMLLQTDGTGTLTEGAARVQSSGPVGVSAIFTLYDVNQNPLTEAGVASSAALDRFVIPVDFTGSFNTGVTLFNFNSTDTTVTYTLFESNGTQVATTGNPKTEPLPAGNHVTKFVSGATGLFPNITSFRGTMLISATQPIAGVTLRQNDAPLSNTTLPVVSSAETRTTFNLAQVANGLDPNTGLTMRTTFIVVNVSNTAATVNFTLRKPDSTPFPVTIAGVVNNAATFSVNVPAGGSAFMQTDNSGALSVGSAEVSSNVPVGVGAIFTLFGPGPAFITEAGVGHSPTTTTSTLPVDITGNFDTGVALFNPSTTPTTLLISLFDAGGVKVADATPLTINPKSQQAKFVDELFPGRTNFRGTLGITGSIAALTLRQNRSPLSYTTLPLSDSVSQGTVPPAAAALLDETRTGIGATTNVTLNVPLQAGFKLSGTVTGAAQLVTSLVATNNTGGQFPAAFNILTSRYLVIVPAGTYTLHACYAPQTGSFENLPSLSFADPNLVQVNADTTRDVAIPAQTLNLVSGTVAGIAQLPTNGGVFLNLSTADGSAGGYATVGANGSYQIQLPNGTYTASLLVSDITVAPNPPQQAMTLYNIGSVVVNNVAVTANFDLPTRAVVSGVARRAGTEHIAPTATVTATDTTAPAIQVVTCNLPATTSQTSVDPSPNFDVQRTYRFLLATGRSYRLTLSFPVGTTGTGFFPTNGQLVGPLAQDIVQFLDVPALPGTVTISGKVTDPQGQPVSGVNVSASSSQITGAADVTFSTSATTDNGGDYSLTVLNGTGYQLFFSPPKPQP